MKKRNNTFQAWEALNWKRLVSEYREYLRDALDNWGDEIITVEDYYEWTREEYMLTERQS